MPCDILSISPTWILSTFLPFHDISSEMTKYYQVLIQNVNRFSEKFWHLKFWPIKIDRNVKFLTFISTSL